MRAKSLRNVSVLSTVLLCDCASAYTLSGESLSIRATLDDQKAQQIIAEALKHDANGKGGANMASGAGGNQHWALDSRLSSTTIEWTIAYADAGVTGHVTRHDLPPNDCERAETPPSKFKVDWGDIEFTYCRYRVDLRQLWRIRVNDADADQLVVAGYLVWIQQGATRFIKVNVPRDGLDRLMAALTLYSPSARLMRGAGF